MYVIYLKYFVYVSVFVLISMPFRLGRILWQGSGNEALHPFDLIFLVMPQQTIIKMFHGVSLHQY